MRLSANFRERVKMEFILISEVAKLPADKADIFHRTIGVVDIGGWPFKYYAGFYHPLDCGDIRLTDDDVKHRWKTRKEAEDAALEIAVEFGAE
jgi:hypothetical protein